jgi:archaeosine synthase
MFEVLTRCGIGRIGRWSLDDKRVETPNVFFISTDRIKPPEDAELLLTSTPIKNKKISLVDSGSLFSKKTLEGNVIPPALGYPLSCNELNKYAFNLNTFDGKICVIYGDSSILKAVDIDKKAEVYVIGSAAELFHYPKRFIETIVTLRKAIGYQKILYVPGIALPNNIAFLIYCGIDLMDGVALIVAARQNYFLTSTGRFNLAKMKELPCHCPACIEGIKNFDQLLKHNYYAMRSEIRLIRNHIKNGNLRELVEMRIRSSPWMVSALRELDHRHYQFQEEYFAVNGGGLLACSNESLHRPDIKRFRERIKTRYKKPDSAKILLLLPCSAKKPYSTSRSHLSFKKAIMASGNPNAVHEVVVTSPLGVVPKELELIYPAQQYDVPVSGDWDADEISMIKEGVESLLSGNKYDAVVTHLPQDMEFIDEFICSIGIDLEKTCEDKPTSPRSLSNLENTLNTLISPYQKISRKSRRIEDLTSISRYQFGLVGKKLLENCVIRGRYPNLRIFKNEMQIGMLTGRRGMISLTIAGAEILAENNAYCVEIDDFEPKGSIFAVGVSNADEQIRIGDDVVVTHNDGVRAVGVALMSPKEMVESTRGEAVKIRHKISKK